MYFFALFVSGHGVFNTFDSVWWRRAPSLFRCSETTAYFLSKLPGTINHLPALHARTERLSAFPDLFASAGIGPFDVCSRRVKLSFGSGACHFQRLEGLRAQKAIYWKITLSKSRTAACVFGP